MADSTDVLVVVGAKGGVGKTTTSLNLAAAMAAAGRSVVAVELDIGMANFVDFIDVEGEDTATIHDVLAGESKIESARRRVSDGFFIAPSGTELTGYANTDIDGLPQVVDNLAWYHDTIIIDTPAGVGEEIVRSLELADEAILVSTPRVASIRNAKNTIELTERIGTDVRGLVLTKSGTGASPGADRIANFLDVPLLGHVPEDDAVPHSQDRGQPVVDYAPRSGAAIAYRTIAEAFVDDAPAPRESTPTANDENRGGNPKGGEADEIDDSTGSEPSTTSVGSASDGSGTVVDRAADQAAGMQQPTGRSEADSTPRTRSDDGPTRSDGSRADHPAAPDASSGDGTENSTERHRPQAVEPADPTDDDGDRGRFRATDGDGPRGGPDDANRTGSSAGGIHAGDGATESAVDQSEKGTDEVARSEGDAGTDVEASASVGGRIRSFLGL